MSQRTKTEQAAILLVRELDKHMDDTGGTERLRHLLAAFWEAWFDEHKEEESNPKAGLPPSTGLP